jgi:endonuclease G, mitochondrial
MKKMSQMSSLRMDQPLVEELKSRIRSTAGLPLARRLNIPLEALRQVVEAPLTESVTDTGEGLLEAIVLLFGRPALRVKNDSFELPDSDEWKARLYPSLSRLERCIRSVGRVEVQGHPSFNWLGTAFMVAEGVAVTNRHVAEQFAYQDGNRFVFSPTPRGDGTLLASVDFKEEYGPASGVLEARVEEVIFLAERRPDQPDLALLRLKGETLPPPLPLSTRPRRQGDLVAAIGYPAWDPRNGMDAMVKVLGDIYDVKRLCLGTISTYDDTSSVFTHDCSTLGGNSGAAIVDVATGEVLGVHFGGRFLQANYAAKAATLLDVLRAQGIQVAVPADIGALEGTLEAVAGEALEEARRRPSYANREGYREDFLRAEQRVPLPTLSAALAPLVSPVRDAQDGVLKYTHFSVVMNRERRMPFFTGVNIDGNQLRRFTREGDAWLYDPRIDRSHQAGDDIYAHNDLDRGHMVRRLDPVWGDPTEARRANDDTFHFTNACPQHKDLNQKEWSELEDYVLDNAGAHGLKVSVFTGPVFGKRDRPYRGVRLPEQFWKVVAFVDERGGKLCATAYVLSQTDFLTNLVFVYGQFRTYQVPVTLVEQLTGLDFGVLKEGDPLGYEEGVRALHHIRGARDLRLR